MKGRTYSDLEHYVNTVAHAVMAEAIKTRIKRHITMEDFTGAIGTTSSSLPIWLKERRRELMQIGDWEPESEIRKLCDKYLSPCLQLPAMPENGKKAYEGG